MMAPRPFLSNAGGNVIRAAALCAVTGHEEERVRRFLAHFAELCWYVAPTTAPTPE